MTRIKESKNYDHFELTDFNRNVDRIDPLVESMKKHGWIDAYPMKCSQNGGDKLKIEAGHHRFKAAQMLGIPVKYVVCKDNATIHELEKATNPWTLRHYFDSYCRQGREDYLRLKKFSIDSEINLPLCASMLIGETAGSGNYNESIKNGTYKVKSTTHAESVADMVRHCKESGVPFYKMNLFVVALSKILWVPEFNIERFKQKITAHHSIMEKKANLQLYLEMIEDVYNRQSSKKIPLAFLATQLAKERSATGIKR